MLNRHLNIFLTGCCFLILFACQPNVSSQSQTRFVSFIADPEQDEIQFYWKDEKDQPFRRLQNLKNHFEANGKKLRFAMNGGMYMENTTPLGLFIQHGETIRPLNTRKAASNFYMQPNGVFLLTSRGEAFIIETENFKADPAIKFATQSGPMLVINGQINSLFQENSKNLNVRNGVGILPDGKVLFAMSKEPVNFHEFALYFQEQGCKQALYLDGYVSRTFLPEKNWQQLDGDFGVIIGVSE